MEVVKLVGQLGQVAPVSQDVLDRAMEKVAGTAGNDPAPVRSGRVPAAGQRLITAGIAAAVLVAASFALVTSLGHGAAGTRGASDGSAAHGSSATATSHSPVPAGGPVTASAILTAFRAAGGDVLRVTKTMRGGFGTLGKTVIWISPAVPGPGAVVRSRIEQFTLAGSPQADTLLTYAMPASVPARAGADCSDVFGRPRVVAPPAPGMPGTLSTVNYLSRSWASGAVRVQAATVPSAIALRACLRDGRWHVAGHGVIGKTRSVRLASADGYEQLWVSAATLLPMRLVSAAPDTDTITFSFTFLAGTAASEAMLNLPRVPGGFARAGI